MGEKRKRSWGRFAAACVLVFNIMFCVTMPIFADMGPKPSVDIRIKNAPKGSYGIGLLVKDEARVRDENDTYSYVKDEDRAMFEKMLEFEEDGWSIAFSPARSPFVTLPGDYGYTADEFHFYYYAPSHFKLILITAEDGAEYISNEIETTRYQAACCYDFETGVLAEDLEKYAQEDKSYVRRCIAFFVGTVIVEGILLFAFGLCSLRNVIVFVIVNALTQFYLHASLFFNNKAHGSGGWVNLISLFGKELLILIVETVLFAIFMRQENEKHGRIVAYGIVANIVSLFAGLFAQTIFR